MSVVVVDTLYDKMMPIFYQGCCSGTVNEKMLDYVSKLFIYLLLLLFPLFSSNLVILLSGTGLMV